MLRLKDFVVCYVVLFRAIEALKKEEEEEKRRWRTQRHAHPTSPEALCAPDLSLVHLMVGPSGKL